MECRRCDVCGAKPGLNSHAIEPRLLDLQKSDFCLGMFFNLICALCPDCHLWIYRLLKEGWVSLELWQLKMQ
jgi:hypothetical protein